eukprot:CAMPEP_0198125496 /NCGR_PEP_ID=MMETSP1442-20131203/42726_1 /TAXON_ID= /ORGANISM="Craspedostauros australis, Strain CCMP3328" /LENGTH=222 /DNA_ID=CAMNT_0043785103 /DNA_START=63 /DNA_END=731 /DNA_ORIENTATION=-
MIHNYLLAQKRFVRDHVRYVDELQCAAARVVHAVRERSKSNPQAMDAEGHFDTFHIRRGDFEDHYEGTQQTAEEIINVTRSDMVPGSTVYIATDESDKSFFDPFKEIYDVVFLDDFMHELDGMNTNFYGMIDQLIAARGRTFFGCWFSTFSGYINRLRGYHADNLQLPGYEQGIVNSYYYAVEGRYDRMKQYFAVKQPYYAREYPTGWRLIDKGIGQFQPVA